MFFMYSTVHIFDTCQEAAPASVRKQSATLFLTFFAVKPPRTDYPSGTSARPVTAKRLQTYNHLSREKNCSEQHWP
jgi:hypothetical protein